MNILFRQDSGANIFW